MSFFIRRYGFSDKVFVRDLELTYISFYHTITHKVCELFHSRIHFSGLSRQVTYSCSSQTVSANA